MGVLKSTAKDYGGFSSLAPDPLANTSLSTVLGPDAKNSYTIDGAVNSTITLPKGANVAGKEVAFYIYGGNGSTNHTFVGNNSTDGNINKPSAVMLDGTGKHNPNKDIQSTTISGINRVAIIANIDKYRYKKITFISDGSNWYLSVP